MNIFERYLTLWVFLRIVVGVVPGQAIPAPFHWLGELEVAKVNILVGQLIEVPVMLSVVYLVKRSQGWYEKG